MRIVWHSKRNDYESVILAGDIGGTNTNLALVGVRGHSFELIVEWSESSHVINGLVEPIRAGVAAVTQELGPVAIERCCISGAGPVEGNRCVLSNLSWDIDAAQIEAAIGIPTRVINDFLAISYGVTLMDVNDPSQITALPQTDGTRPAPAGDVHLVVGAGTGLGVGIVIRHGRQILAYPSEGGHAGFAPFDAESEELRRYITRETSSVSEIEQFISGRGIANIFNFFRDVRQVRIQGILKDINNAPDLEKPALIGTHAETNPVCRDIMRMFVKIYGHICSDLATVLLPGAGIYLAGGIVAKNEKYFVDGGQFMYYFAQNFRPAIADLLRTYPVYLIRNYNISLLGAAHAAVQIDYQQRRLQDAQA